LSFEQTIQPFAGQLLTQAVLMDLLKEYHWPHNKIRELEKKGLLSPIKRGLYTTGPKLKLPRPSAFLIANHIYGPSYVSMEAALSHWELIPEKVVNITSMTTGPSRNFRTPAGLFSYKKMRLPYYCYGIQQVELSHNQTVLMAGPEKAICDLIVTRAGVILRSTGNVSDFLIEDLRIERRALQELKREEIKTWIAHAPKKSSLNMLVKTLEKL
jgi:hypothetical protein